MESKKPAGRFIARIKRNCRRKLKCAGFFYEATKRVANASAISILEVEMQSCLPHAPLAMPRSSKKLLFGEPLGQIIGKKELDFHANKRKSGFL